MSDTALFLLETVVFLDSLNTVESSLLLVKLSSSLNWVSGVSEHYISYLLEMLISLGVTWLGDLLLFFFAFWIKI